MISSGTDMDDWSYSPEPGVTHLVMHGGCAAVTVGARRLFGARIYGAERFAAAGVSTTRSLWLRVEPPAFMAGLETLFTQCG